MIPDSQGGPLSLDNSVISCVSCNNKRGDKSITDFHSSDWLNFKRRDVLSRLKKKKGRPLFEGREATDQEIRKLASTYLEGLTKTQLVGIILSMSRQTVVDSYARRSLEK